MSLTLRLHRRAELRALSLRIRKVRGTLANSVLTPFPVPESTLSTPVSRATSSPFIPRQTELFSNHTQVLAATPMHQTTRHAKAHDTAADTLLVLDQRAGLYKLPMPFVLGNESAGIVTEVGEGVTEFVVGDAVAAYTLGGGFAEYAKNAATKTAKVPASLSTKDAATILLQGLTGQTHHPHCAIDADTVSQRSR